MSNSALVPGAILRSPKREYTIRRVLGQGGFGITYLVDTPLKLENISFKGKFAIKEHFLSMLCAREPGSSNINFLPNSTQEVERSLKAFIAEAQRLQKLGINHRNIVEVNEVFECNRTAYYVMEYIDGGSLADYVKAHGGRLSWSETSALMRPICEAVAMLHSNKVAHYDIKPQNIMIQLDEDGVRPVLIDFGLAKHYDGQGQATSSLAAAGYTPGYAPIEQYTGLRQFSPAADVYALAATICYCLTGHAPAKADELDLDALCDELLSLGVDDAVANVLLHALELRAAKRPADAGVLAAALFAAAPPATVRQRQPAVQQPARCTNSTHAGIQSKVHDNVDEPKPRRRWLVMSIIIAVLTIGVLILSTFGSGRHADSNKDTCHQAENVTATTLLDHTAEESETAEQKPELTTTTPNIDQQKSTDISTQDSTEAQLAQIEAELQMMSTIESIIRQADVYSNVPSVTTETTLTSIIERYNERVNQLNRMLETSTPDNPLVSSLQEELTRDKVRILQNIAAVRQSLEARRRSIMAIKN